MPHISTLVPDIHKAVDEAKVPSEEDLNNFAENCKRLLKEQLGQFHNKKPTLRMSNIGQPDRKLWYTIKDYPGARLTPTQRISFIYGNLVEEFGLLLVKLAGHSVTEEQKEVVLDGIKGHIDAYIDGVLTDVKGMSPYGFTKFATGAIARGQDAFGYIPQLSGYAQAENQDQAAFLVMDKAKGNLHLSHFDEFELVNSKARIEHVKVMIESPTPPGRCYEDEEDGKSGNRILGKSCSYCPFKKTCWSDANNGQGLKVYGYKIQGRVEPKFFTQVTKPPRVDEITSTVLIVDGEEPDA